MFHELTDRLGQAVIELEVQHKKWPDHRFYFGRDDAEMAALLADLKKQPGVQDISTAIWARQPDLAGLYIKD